MWLATPIVILVTSLPAAIVAYWRHCRPVYVAAVVGEALAWLFLRPSFAARYHDPLDKLAVDLRCDLGAVIPGMIAGAAIGWIIFRPRGAADTMITRQSDQHQTRASTGVESTT